MSYEKSAPQGKISSPTLFGLIKDFEPQLSRLQKVRLHLDSIADHIGGTQPQEPSGIGADTPPHSILNDIERKREALATLCSQLESVVSRLDDAVGGMNSIGPTEQ